MGVDKNYGPWIDWDGRTKRCPLKAGTRHQVRFRNGDTAHDDSPETWDWKHHKGVESTMDIVAYRVAR